MSYFRMLNIRYFMVLKISFENAKRFMQCNEAKKNAIEGKRKRSQEEKKLN